MANQNEQPKVLTALRKAMATCNGVNDTVAVLYGANDSSAAKTMMSYAQQNAKGDVRVYRDAELALITQSKRTMELFLDGTPIRYRKWERDKKGRLVKCEAYFYQEKVLHVEVK